MTAAVEPTFEVSLHLEDVNELFVAPEANPLKRTGAYQSGVDYIAARVKAGRKKAGKIHVTLYLPLDKIEAGLEQRVREALLDYCQYKIGESQDKLDFHHLLTRREFRIGLLVFVVSAVVVAAGAYIVSENTQPLVLALTFVVGYTFVIAGWVAMWIPVEMFLYDWAPYGVDKVIYTRMSAMTIDIRPETGAKQ